MSNYNLLLQLSELSKIKFSDKEISEFCDDFSEMVALMDKVKSFNINSENIAKTTLNYKDISANNKANEAFDIQNNHFVVPKIIQENIL